MPRVAEPLIDQLMRRVEKTETCWLWTGSVGADGYGRFHFHDPATQRKRTQAPHRWLWVHLNGEPPEGHTLDHEVCDTPLCVNPDHLVPKPHRDNLMRSKTALAAINARKTHCHRGHPFSETNTYVTPDGRRQCRTCRDR